MGYTSKHAQNELSKSAKAGAKRVAKSTSKAKLNNLSKSEPKMKLMKKMTKMPNAGTSSQAKPYN